VRSDHVCGGTGAAPFIQEAIGEQTASLAAVLSKPGTRYYCETWWLRCIDHFVAQLAGR
jgi:hypothetical protein